MLRIRLGVPLNLFLNAKDTDQLNPSLKFDYGHSEVRVTLKGGLPLRVEKSDEPHFRTIYQCQIEIREKENSTHSLLGLVESKDFEELVNSLMPIVNRTLAGIRNFGWVTTAREYRAEEKPETLLRAWQAMFRVRGSWKEIAPPPKRGPFDFIGFAALEGNVERGSLSVARWRDIEQALVEGLKPNPEQEFLTNALQHLRDGNLRLAIIEATVCLEIVLSQTAQLYLEVKRHFPKKKAEVVLNNVGLTSRVGLVVSSILSHSERNTSQIDKVLRAINWRNKIVHRTGHLDPSVPSEEVHDAVYEMLNLALALGRKREKLRAEPEVEEISKAIREQFDCPSPEIEVLKYHEISTTFSFPSEVSAYLRPFGATKTSETKIPDQEGLQRIVSELGLKLKARDPRFDPKKHLSVTFQHGLLARKVFATLEKGEWKQPPIETGSKIAPIIAAPA
jgi:hypothetical protein